VLKIPSSPKSSNESKTEMVYVPAPPEAGTVPLKLNVPVGSPQ
jgi:hypothetical protein